LFPNTAYVGQSRRQRESRLRCVTLAAAAVTGYLREEVLPKKYLN